jgi:Tubulin like
MKFYERYGEFGYPCMSYVWIDTDLKNVNVDKKPLDPILQKALLSQGETVDIQVLDPSDFLDNPGKFPWITRWMPPPVVQSSLRIQEGAGQVRSKGRFAFYWNYQKVRTKLEQAIERVRQSGARTATVQFNQEHHFELLLDDNWGTLVNVFIISSVAGGTGSGIFLDTAFLLRDIASGAGGQNFKPDITGLLFLSSLFTSDSRDRRFANAYAALKELEYYNYTPEAGARDIEDKEGTRKTEIYSLRKFEEKWSATDPQTPVNGPPFNTCYLIDGYTFGGTPVTAEHKDECFEMASEYLFWEFYRGQFAAQKRTLRPNNRQFLDKNYTEPHGPDDSPFHMQRFSTGYSSFGLSWIRIPVGRRISACGYRLSQEMLEYWERGGTMSKAAAQELLRKRNVVDEVRKAITGDPVRLSGAGAVQDLATLKDGTKFSEVLKRGIDEFSELPEANQVPSPFAAEFEERYLTRRVGAIINDNIEPSRIRTFGDYKERMLKWVVQSLETEGFIPLLGFTFENPDGSEGSVKGYLDVVTDVILPELEKEIEMVKDSFTQDKESAEERKETFFNNFDELNDSFVLFRNQSRKILIRKCLEAENSYAVSLVGEWVCDIAFQVVQDLKEYVKETKARLTAFHANILSPVIAEFAELRRRNEVEEHATLSVNLYRPLNDYYRLDGNPVDVKAEKEQLFRESLGDLWKVTTQMTKEQFGEPVEKYGLRKFQNDFQSARRRGQEILGNAIQLFNEQYPPSEQTQRRNQISIFLEGGKPYVQPRMALGPKAPQPHEDIFLGMNGISPETPVSGAFFKELTTQYNVSQAQPMETEPESILYYHELTGLPLFYLSSLEQYRQSYDLFQGTLGELPVHFHRRVDFFPEIFLYNPKEARGMFDAWENLIIGTLLRVLQVESAGGDFRYFYYSGYSAETKVIGDERGSVRSLFTDPTRFAWCGKEIQERTSQIYQDPKQLRSFYGLLQLLSKEVFTADTARLAGGQHVDLPSFPASVIKKHISAAEQRDTERKLPHRNPGEISSPEWEELMKESREGAESVTLANGSKSEARYYLRSITPFALR